MKYRLEFDHSSIYRFLLRGILGLVMFITFIESANAQYFSKRYSILGFSNGYISSTQIINDTVYAMCYVNDTLPPYYPIASFEKFDKHGNLLNRNPLNIPDLINIWANNNTLIHTNDGGFAYGAYIGIDSITNALVILKYDHHGNFQWFKKIIDSNSLAFECAAIIQDRSSNYYLTGAMQHTISYDADMYVVKTDSLGGLLYKKVFLHPNADDGSNGICFNNKGHIVIGGYADLYNINDFSTARYYKEIYEIDTSGNLLNHILGTDTNGPDASNILPTNDGGYLIAGSYFCYRDRHMDKWLGSISKLDSNFNEVWRWDAGPCSQYTAFISQKQSPDGNYVAVGKSYDDANTSIHKNGWVVKYSGNGQIIWNKLYRGITSDGYNGDENDIYSIAFMSDSSILCAGQAANYDDTINSQKGWLLHLDAAGCLPDSLHCGAISGISEIQQAIGTIRAYPNPASDQIRFEVLLDQPSDYTLYITNVIGQKISETSLLSQTVTTNIDVRQWHSGLYIYKVTSEKGFTFSGEFVVSH